MSTEETKTPTSSSTATKAAEERKENIIKLKRKIEYDAEIIEQIKDDISKMDDSDIKKSLNFTKIALEKEKKKDEKTLKRMGMTLLQQRHAEVQKARKEAGVSSDALLSTFAHKLFPQVKKKSEEDTSKKTAKRGVTKKRTRKWFGGKRKTKRKKRTRRKKTRNKKGGVSARMFIQYLMDNPDELYTVKVIQNIGQQEPLIGEYTNIKIKQREAGSEYFKFWNDDFYFIRTWKEILQGPDGETTSWLIIKNSAGKPMIFQGTSSFPFGGGKRRKKRTRQKKRTRRRSHKRRRRTRRRRGGTLGGTATKQQLKTEIGTIGRGGGIYTEPTVPGSRVKVGGAGNTTTMPSTTMMS